MVRTNSDSPRAGGGGRGRVGRFDKEGRMLGIIANKPTPRYGKIKWVVGVGGVRNRGRGKHTGSRTSRSTIFVAGKGPLRRNEVKEEKLEQK